MSRAIEGLALRSGVRRAVPILFAAALLSHFACTSGRPGPAPALPQPEDPASAAPPPSVPGPTVEDLEALRAAVIAYYRTEKPEHWEGFAAELERDAIFLAGELYEGSPPAIGVWHLEDAEGRPALVRQPPVPEKFPALMFYFGVYLTRQDGTWRVTGEYSRVEEVS